MKNFEIERKGSGIMEGYRRLEDFPEPKRLAPKSAWEFCVPRKQLGEGRRTLRLIGETEMPLSYRSEPKFPLLYRKLDDSLALGANGEWELRFEGRGEGFERAFYHMYRPDDKEKSGRFALECRMEREECPDAEIRLEAQVYCGAYHTRTAYETPDDVHSLQLVRSGTFRLSFAVKQPIDFILLKFSVRKYRGKMTVSAPVLYKISDSERRVTPPFAPHEGLECGTWVGKGFSKTDWPSFRILWNGREIFAGERFQRIYHNPAYEFPVPDDCVTDGENRIVIEYGGTGESNRDFLLRAVEIWEEERPPRVVACRPYVTRQVPFSVAYEADEIPEWTVSDPAIRCLSACAGEAFGLKFATFVADRVCVGAELSFRTKSGEVRSARIVRVVERGEDGIVTGTGDSVYIGQNEREFSQFLRWYIGNDIGDLVTFRPVYRWSGSFDRDPALWKETVAFCEGYGLLFCHMLDGRELNGYNANPPEEWLKSPLFLGTQAHEKDGSFYYWQNNTFDAAEETFCNALSQEAERMGILTRRMPVYRDDRIFRYYDNACPIDMKGAYEALVDNLRQIPEDAERHTGVTVLYHAFYEAGVSFLGAELMYGTQELILSALRGASRAHKKSAYGSHLAMQWYCTPHDTVEHAKRYQISLYLSYLNGVSQINTEEGLWRLEENYAEHERFSPACQRLLEVQRDFNRFVRTHTRRGTQVVRTAAIQGRYDGWCCFGREKVYGRDGEEWAFGAPEESWDLLKVFYPGAVLDAIYRHPCPKEPIGLATAVPYGILDLVPCEADLSSYERAFLLGYHCCSEEDVERWTKYVSSGGTLVLGACHFQTGTDRMAAIRKTSPLLDTPAVHALLGVKKLSRTEMVRGEAEKTDLKGVLVHRIGAGTVWFVESDSFPSEEEVRPVYEELLRRLGEQNAMEQPRGTVRAEGAVSTAVYQDSDVDTHYLLNVAWWTDAPQTAVFSFGGVEHKISVAGHDPVLVVAGERYAVCCRDRTAEVLSVRETSGGVEVTVQADGETELEVYQAGKTGSVKTKPFCGGVSVVRLEKEEFGKEKV